MRVTLIYQPHKCPLAAIEMEPRSSEGFSCDANMRIHVCMCVYECMCIHLEFLSLFLEPPHPRAAK